MPTPATAHPTRSTCSTPSGLERFAALALAH